VPDAQLPTRAWRRGRQRSPAARRTERPRRGGRSGSHSAVAARRRPQQDGATYEPRRPEDTVLYQLVSEHLESFVEHAEESYAKPLPRYVLKELRGYLKCGRLEEGFLRCRCDGCGAELLVPFSCGARTICPLCFVAAHLVDLVGKTPNRVAGRWRWRFRS